MEPFVRRWVRPSLWILVLSPAVLIGWQAYQGDLGANPIEKLEILTGHWTLRFLAGSLAVTPLMRLTGWGWLVAQRRFMGLATFAWACTHLLTYVVLDWFFDFGRIVEDVLKHLYITVGMLAFLLLVPLAVTSTKASIRRLGGKRWTQLHRLVYVAAVAGCVHFLWAVKKDVQEPIIYSVIFAVLLLLRLVWRRRRTSAPAAP